MHFLGSLPNHGEWAALTLTNSVEYCQILRLNRHYVAFLRLVAPDFKRRHPRLVIGHITQLKHAAATAVFYEFGEGIGQPTGTHIVNKGYGIILSQLPATVYHFLTTTFHLRVLPLHGREIQILMTLTTGHGRSSATAETDQH